jgi:phage host-nuclease inhibitor protein Gam
LEIQRLKSETNLQIAKIEERRSKKLQSLRDEIAQFSKERDGLRQQNISLEQELQKAVEQIEINP